MSVPHDIAAETELWDTFAESAFKDDAEPVFCWTQYAGHGPGPELLGSPRRVLEIGCGTGRAVAHLAQQGIEAHGVDLSPVMVKQVSERWADTGATFECAEVLEWLTACEDTFLRRGLVRRPGPALPPRARSAQARRHVRVLPAAGDPRRTWSPGHVQGRLRREGDVHLPL